MCACDVIVCFIVTSVIKQGGEVPIIVEATPQSSKTKCFGCFPVKSNKPQLNCLNYLENISQDVFVRVENNRQCGKNSYFRSVRVKRLLRNITIYTTCGGYPY